MSSGDLAGLSGKHVRSATLIGGENKDDKGGGGGGSEWEECQRADGISGRVHLSTPGLGCSENTGLRIPSPTTSELLSFGVAGRTIVT